MTQSESLPPSFAWLLADLGLERNPHVERGLTVWALIVAGSALLALSLATRRGGVLARSGSAPPVSTPDENITRGWPFMRKVFIGLGQLLGGIFIIYGLARLTASRPPMPEGWSLICPPHEAIAIVKEGDTVWAGGKEGLVAVDRRTLALRKFPRIEARDVRGVRALLADRDSLWIGCRQGLFLCRDERLDPVLPPGGGDIGPVSALLREPGGALWVGVRGGVWRVETPPAGPWRWFGPADGLSLPSVDVIHRDGAGNIWFGSNEPESEGLFRMDGGNGSFSNEGAGFASHAVNGLLTDHDGTLWVATGFGTRGAALHLTHWQWIPQSDIPEIATAKIRSLFEDSHQRMWFCSEYSGVAILHGGQWKRLTPKEGLPGAEVKAMIEDEDGTLWLATEHGLGCLRPGPALGR